MTGMKGLSALMTSSLAEADARVVITTSRSRPSACDFGSKRVTRLSARVLVVVKVLREHLAVGSRAADQAGQVLGDSDEAASVVAQVEHQFPDAAGAEVAEGGVERFVRRRDEVPEEQVADFAAVGRIHLRE